MTEVQPAVDRDSGQPTGGRREPLNRWRVLECALAYVDRHGLAGLTMRRLGAELGVEGMSLYKHVADKDALLDGIVELLWTEVPTAPQPGADWRDALRELAGGLREVFHRHPNCAPLLATRNFLNIEMLRRYQAYLDALRQAGFERQRALDAMGTVVGQALGFALLELRYVGAEPCAVDGDSDIQRIRRVTRCLPDDVPDTMIELAVELSRGCDAGWNGSCFAVSIDALLAGLAPGRS